MEGGRKGDRGKGERTRDTTSERPWGKGEERGIENARTEGGEEKTDHSPGKTACRGAHGLWDCSERKRIQERTDEAPALRKAPGGTRCSPGRRAPLHRAPHLLPEDQLLREGSPVERHPQSGFSLREGKCEVCFSLVSLIPSLLLCCHSEKK